jgi:CBS domain-containing protein
MIAANLAEHVPTVSRETLGSEAARVIAEYRLPGLVVADDDGVPIAVVPGSQLLAVILPQYVREDPHLAHVFEEKDADELCAKLNHTTIGELLDSQRIVAKALPSVLPEDTVLEVAAVMVAEHTPLIVVRGEDGTYHGAVMLSRALAAIATRAGQNSELMRHRLERDILPAPTRPAPATEDDGQ